MLVVSRSRSRSPRGPSEGGGGADARRPRSRSGSASPELSRELLKRLSAFRERFPVDDRAFDFLEKAPLAALEIVLTDFKPSREGQSDYSALLTNFVRQVRARVDRGVGPPPRRSGAGPPARGGGGRGASGGRGKRGARSRERRPRRHHRRRIRRLRRRADRSSSCGSSDGGDDLGSEGSSTGSRSIRSGSAGSSSSGSSSESVDDEDEVKRVAKARVERAVEDAREEETRRVSAIESDAVRTATDRVAQVMAEADQEMRDKLAEYKAQLQADRQAKIDDATRLAQQEQQDTVRRAREEARDERMRRVRDAENDADDMLKKLREERANKVKARAQRKAEKTEAKKTRKDGKAPPVAKVRERRIKVPRADRSVSPPGGERRHRRRRRRPRPRLDDLSDDLGPSRSRGPGARGRGRGDSRSPSDSRGRSNDDSRDGRRRRSRRGMSPTGPSDRDMQAFRDRYPMDERAFADLTSAPPDVRRRVIGHFKPRREGEADYSALVASFVRSILKARPVPGPRPLVGGSGLREFRDVRDLPRDRDDGGRGGSRGRSRDRGGSLLENFRKRYPMDERAFHVLSNSSTSVQATVISDFRPKREGEDDYSALVMAFARAVQGRSGGGARGGDRDRD